ncbi:MAG TPA: APC family permease [Mycobacteriales bacterium]|nr:APC family permease [Mycobacteriales bacterium]
MTTPVAGLKRLLVGRPLRSTQLNETLLPKWIALPVFCSDPISSVAYATEEIVLVLAAGGLAYLSMAKWVAVAVALLLFVVVMSYRQTCYAYPTGGGAFAVSLDSFGPGAALVAASALLVDYVMTVAVSIVSGVVAITSAATSLAPYAVELSVGFVVLLVLANLRGVRESGRLFAIPTYSFVVLTFLMFAVAILRGATGHLPHASTAHQHLRRTVAVGGVATWLLALRAFASGCTALTGVEAISNGVPSFRKPKARNAALTLSMMGGLAISMFVGITVLALRVKARAQASGNPSVISQVAAAAFGGHDLFFFLYQASTAAILILAANTAFNGFPGLSSILAHHRYLPRQLHNRGDRLVFSNGILILGGLATALIVGFDANIDKLIQLYIIGVFTSFTLSQAGMVKHWTKLLVGTTGEHRRKIQVSRGINVTGAVATALVLVVVLYTKVVHGAWIAIVAMVALYFTMRGIHRHYESVSEELDFRPEQRPTMPSRNHAVVLVSRLHLATMRALAYARATRPSTLVAVTINLDQDDVNDLMRRWNDYEVPEKLVVLDSPYREILRPLLRYLREQRQSSPRDVVTVFIPEYIVGRWWEQLLHNQSALRLKARLLFEPGVMVTSVPWQLRSSDKAVWGREGAAEASDTSVTSPAAQTSETGSPLHVSGAKQVPADSEGQRGPAEEHREPDPRSQ